MSQGTRDAGHAGANPSRAAGARRVGSFLLAVRRRLRAVATASTEILALARRRSGWSHVKGVMPYDRVSYWLLGTHGLEDERTRTYTCMRMRGRSLDLPRSLT